MITMLRRDPLTGVLVAGCGLMVAWLSVARYLGYNAGMLDLGNMAQAIWSGTQGLPLTVTFPHVGSLSRLGLHVELIYYLFVPFYALWPDPRLLLVAQAGLYVLAAIPVYRMAWRATGTIFAARSMALIYLLYPTAQTSVLFDFHGDTLAMALLLFALDALDTRTWRTYALFIALALTCKFYVAVPVFGTGVVLAWWGSRPDENPIPVRWAGAWTILAALVYGSFIFLVVRPHFAPGSGGAAHTAGWYLQYYFGRLAEIVPTWDVRLLNAVIVFGPAILVIWRGWRWLLPGLPVALAALLSTGPLAYLFAYHHYALVVPFIVAAATDGIRRLAQGNQTATTPPAASPPGSRRRSWRSNLGLTLASVLLFHIALVDTPLSPRFWGAAPRSGLHPSRYGITPRDAIKDRFLAEHITPRVPLAASDLLAPHLANRRTLYLVRYPGQPPGVELPGFLPHVDEVVADGLFEFYQRVDYERAEIAFLLRDPDFGLVAARDGLLVFRRDVPPEQVLRQRVELVEPRPPVALPLSPATAYDPDPDPEQDPPIRLVASHLTHTGGRRYRATFEWAASPDALGSLPEGGAVAVSTLEQVPNARIVHLPTYALLPVADWPAGQNVRETFDVVLPNEIAPGRYTWRVGWYTLRDPASFATDQRSLLPGSQWVSIGTLEISQVSQVSPSPDSGHRQCRFAGSHGSQLPPGRPPDQRASGQWPGRCPSERPGPRAD